MSPNFLLTVCLFAVILFEVSPMHPDHYKHHLENELSSGDVSRLTQLDEQAADTFHAEEIHLQSKKAIPLLSHTEYLTLAEIYSWLDGVATSCGQLCEMQVLGQTASGGNQLRLLRVGVPKCGSKQKMWIDCGIHAREWIAVSTCVYVISKLLDLYTRDTQITAMLDNYDWYIAPIVNPDGYTYSHTSDRFWRKNKRDNSGLCEGVDLNRNWDVNFGGQGSSGLACSNTYHGPVPFSEAETRVFADFILNNSGWKSYLTLHSYGQLILYPIGYENRVTSNQADLHAAGLAFQAGIYNSSGATYEVFQSSDLYVASGASDDWAYEKAGIVFSYTIELRNNNTFDLPSSQIIPTGEEIVAGLKSYMAWLEINGHIADTSWNCSAT